jgi:hypothetical protein
MSTDPSAPISQMRGGIWLQRFVGLLSAIAGLAIGWLLGYVAYKISVRGGAVEESLIALLLVLAALTAFLLSAGVRMLLNHPNRFGSVFSPVTWYTAAVLFLVGGAFLVFQVIASGQSSIAIKPVLYAFFFGILSAWAGWRASRKSRKPPQSAA